MTPPMTRGFEIGKSLAEQAIPEVLLHALAYQRDPDFWSAFLSGVTGAMSACIGFDAADTILREALNVNDEMRRLKNSNAN